MENRYIRILLKRYLLGNGDDTENTTVDNWYQSFDSEPVTLTDQEAEATGKEIWARIEPATSGAAPMAGMGKTTDRAKVRRMPNWARVAAAILIVAITGATYYILRKPSTPQFATIITGIGEMKRITLDDGSVLTLDVGTTIRVEKDNSKQRYVEVADGRVFFDVKRDDAHPFTVRSQGLTTTVLGTSFTVSAYQGLHDLKVGVITGRVKVQSAINTIAILEKNEELSFNKTTGTYRTIALDESMTAWQDGRLLLNDLPFPEMAVLMQKNFGVVITTTQDAVKHTRYTTELLRSMTADEAIEVLAAIHHLKIKKQDNKIFLYK